MSNIPIEIPILWPPMVMVGPRPRVLLTPPLLLAVPVLKHIGHVTVFSTSNRELLFARTFMLKLCVYEFVLVFATFLGY
jgi:hypothetical protein